MNNIEIALIGCGRVAAHHARSIAAEKGVRLAAVCDLDMDKAAALGDEYGVPAYADYHKMLAAHPDVQAAAVITPSGMHHEHALDIMRRHKRHVIVEKPAFMRPSQADDAYACADELGLKVFPVFQNRHNKAVRRVKAALDSGELGAPRIISVRTRWCRPQRYYDLAPWRGTFSHDGGVLSNQAVHHIDLLRYLGGDVARVNARMATLGAGIEVEDSAVATLEFASGAIGVLEATTAARPDDFEASFSIVGGEGLAQIGGIAVNELQVFTPDPAACAAASEKFTGIKGHGAVYGYGHAQIYADIAADLAGGRAYPVDRADCRGTLRLLHAFYRSDESGGWAGADTADESPRLGRADDAVSGLYRTPAP
ncbi:MAG: Gfo/Idh/MocA family protein [Rhodospirillales bacterium]